MLPQGIQIAPAPSAPPTVQLGSESDTGPQRQCEVLAEGNKLGAKKQRVGAEPFFHLHKEKWLTNLKDKPGRRLGQLYRKEENAKDQKPTQTPSPRISGAHTLPAWLLVQMLPRCAGNGSPRPQQMQVCTAAHWQRLWAGPVPCSSHTRDISIEGVQESKKQKQKQPWLLCLLQGPQQLQHEEQQTKGEICTGSLPGFASTFPPWAAAASWTPSRSAPCRHWTGAGCYPCLQEMHQAPFG